MSLWKCWIKTDTKAIDVRIFQANIIGVYGSEEDAFYDAQLAGPPLPDSTEGGKIIEQLIKRASKALGVEFGFRQELRTKGIIGVYACKGDADTEKQIDPAWEEGKRNSKTSGSGTRAKYTGKRPNYLQNKGKNDPKAIIYGKYDDYKKNKPYKNYTRDLIYDLIVLGFYRRPLKIIEIDKGGKTLKRIRKRPIPDDWRPELEKAIKYFHKVAMLSYRLSGELKTTHEVDGGIPIYKDPCPWDIKDDQVKAEIKGVMIGDRSKEELLRWLGEAYYNKPYIRPIEKKVTPLKRNPYIYSFWDAYRHFKDEGYGSGPIEFNEESGRILHATNSGFVCTTIVNWFVSHLMVLGPNAKNMANAPISYAWNNKGYKNEEGKIINRSYPRYYTNFFSPAFNVSWAEDQKAKDATKKVIDLLTTLKIPANPFAETTFDQGDENAKSIDKRKVLVIYKIDKLYGVKLKGNGGEVPVTKFNNNIITLAEDLPAKETEIVVTYRAKDVVCKFPEKALPWNSPDFKCRCGLHKSYNEIINRSSELGTWSIGSVITSSSWGYSAFTIYKDEANKLYAIHTGDAHFQPFEKEAEGNRNLYILYTVDKKDIERRNPVFFHNPFTGETSWDPTKKSS